MNKSYIKGYISKQEECVICLTTVKDNSSINCCKHQFCYECIKSWSNYCNICPLCKLEFNSILIDNKKKIMNIYRKNYKLNDNDEFYFEDHLIVADSCMKCKKSDDESNLLICDKCNFNICHTSCANLTQIPEGEWFCFECLDLSNYINNDYFNKNMGIDVNNYWLD